MQSTAEATKVCAGPCGRKLPLSAFHRRGDTTQAYCKECSRDRATEWKRENYIGSREPDPSRRNDAIIIHPVDLVGIADIARRLSVKRCTVEYWMRRDARFPLPLARLGDKRGIPVWDYREVEGYIEKTQQQRRK